MHAVRQTIDPTENIFIVKREELNKNEEYLSESADENFVKSARKCRRRRKKKPRVQIRPIDVPKAPENSTQFIIDDHEDCNLYKSFENPGNVLNESSEQDTVGGSASDSWINVRHAAFHDIDYEYELPDDLDHTAFYEEDFENAYAKIRVENLLLMTEEELAERCAEYEAQKLALEKQLSQYDPELCLEQLQQKLLMLQEENEKLKKYNRSLKQYLYSQIDELSDEYSETDVDDGSLSDDESSPDNDGDSSGSTCILKDGESSGCSEEKESLFPENLENDNFLTSKNRAESSSHRNRKCPLKMENVATCDDASSFPSLPDYDLSKTEVTCLGSPLKLQDFNPITPTSSPRQNEEKFVCTETICNNNVTAVRYHADDIVSSDTFLNGRPKTSVDSKNDISNELNNVVTVTEEFEEDRKKQCG
ncbi:uncharacterized protein LOC111089007 [Limulus polyphemus]|uniref:Uncharacterized protein LOC111089007 n=1 Tax=Limulus polyphemus TaxID=6850 RepID=A0ABM1TKB2_LIMPO|nr:uncharacterized protein LOC111089007 [Limulus polyphemus]XP_022256369.1 uncharacterized protein LOC111089007 [Limulus polyphemus]XP_022256416.1 uncharacterized protein LOC111089007 [Limulus polyphemus]